MISIVLITVNNNTTNTNNFTTNLSINFRIL